MPNLDQMLQMISYIAWLLFGIFAIVTIIYTFRLQGTIAVISQMLSARLLLFLLVAVGISFVSTAVVYVPATQVAVVESLISRGAVRPQPLRSGLHLILPILEKEVLYPIYWQTYTTYSKRNEGTMADDDSILARTSDGQEVRLNISVIFSINPEQAVRIHADWQDRYIEDLLRPMIRNRVSTQISQFTVREVNSSARRDLEFVLNEQLRDELASKGIIVDQFLLSDIFFTDVFARAIEEKQAALEDDEKTLHQADQIRNLALGESDRHIIEAQGRKQQLILEAEGQAQALKLIAEALAQNPDLLTYEYINKLSPNIRAMLVPNNAPLILPLPELANEFSMVEITTPVTGSILTPTTLTPTISTIESPSD